MLFVVAVWYDSGSDSTFLADKTVMGGVWYVW